MANKNQDGFIPAKSWSDKGNTNLNPQLNPETNEFEIDSPVYNPQTDSFERANTPSQLEESSQYAFWRKEKTPAQASTYTGTYSPHTTPKNQPTERQEQDGGLEEGAKQPSLLQTLRSYLPQTNSANPEIPLKEIGKAALYGATAVAIAFGGLASAIYQKTIPENTIYNTLSKLKVDPKNRVINPMDHNQDGLGPDYSIRLEGVNGEKLPQIVFLQTKVIDPITGEPMRNNKDQLICELQGWADLGAGQWRNLKTGEVITGLEQTQRDISPKDWQSSAAQNLLAPGDENYPDLKPSLF